MKKNVMIAIVFLAVFIMIHSANAGAVMYGGSNTQSAADSVAIASPVFNSPGETTGHGYRGFAVPGDVHFPGLPSYFGKAVPGSGFQSAKTMLIYKKSFTKDQLENMAKMSMFDDAKIVVTSLVDDDVEDETKSDTIDVFLRNPMMTISKVDDRIVAIRNDKDFEMIGFGTIKTDDEDVVSAKELARICLKARDLGATAIHITAEGVDRNLESFGFGVSLGNSTSYLDGKEQVGTTSTGMTGISWGTSKYQDYPWMQVFFLIEK